jgi:transcription termination factor NusB
MSNDEVIAEFSAQFPNVYKAMLDVKEHDGDTDEAVTHMIATVLATYTPEELARTELAVSRISPKHVKQLRELALSVSPAAAALPHKYPNLFRSMSAMVEIADANLEALHELMEYAVTQWTEDRLLKVETAFIRVGPEEADKLMISMWEQVGRPTAPKKG